MIALAGVTIQSQIYESSVSLIYRGIREVDGRTIIIKLLKQEYPSPEELIRYRQEYEITCSLNLEGVAKAYSQQNYQRTLAIFLEDFGGESLEYWMKEHPGTFCPMPLFAFLQMAIALTDTLGKIHGANVIHKDINPGNIVLNPDTGVVKVIDFGIATRFSCINPTFKSPHGLEGTLAYLSPEQTGRMNRLLDYRTDFYSLGVTFYELLTGQRPFTTTDILELIHCHLARLPIPLHELNCAIPRPVSDIILKLMAKNAEDRYQSAWGIKADLENCAAQLEANSHIAPFQLGLQDVSEQFQIPQKLYGREAEVAALLAAFEQVAESGEACATPQPSTMMLVTGYAGIGKSVLVQELYKPITAKRGYFTSGKFDQLQRNTPYSAIVDALRKLMQQLLGEPNEQVQQWRSQLLNALGENGQLIIDVIPEVELIVGKQPPVLEVGATEAQNRFNRVFQQFIRAFCSAQHPLVIFLDDLQWIDSATLKLVELMLLDEQTQSLFLIGAYRDNEVFPTHPLALTLESLRQQGAVIQEIVLAPLTLEPLTQLIAETLHHKTNAVSSLAQLVLHKTEGNPFFVCEFLRSLHSENLLTFDTECLNWQWNIAQIKAHAITDNVVELLLIKLKKLPENTQQILHLAACIGTEFDLGTLAIVYEQSSKTVFQDLLTAVQAGLIQPISELDEDLLIQEYRFLHDRVQQAAYALIDESQKQLVHLQIGRNLLEKTLPEYSLERLFEIVDHLNHGIELLSDQSERHEIAKLNLLAGQKAKAATAYRTAKAYLTTAIELLAVDSWDLKYAFTLSVYEANIEMAYLCGDFDEMENWATIVLQQANNILDKVKVYEVKILTCMARRKTLEAIEIGLEVLEMLGIVLPKSPTSVDIQQQLEKTQAAWNGKNIADLINLPLMTDVYKLAAIQIMSSITAAAYVAAPSLLPLIICEQVNLSIAYGNIPFSAYAYAAYGIILSGIVNDSESAYQFGQLALNLVERLNAKAIKCRTFHVVAVASIHVTKHLKEALAIYQEAYFSGIETGDLEYASYAAYCKCQYSYSVGLELPVLEQEMASYSSAIAQLKQETAFNWHQIFRQSVLNLLGREQNPCCLSGAAYNEEKFLPLHLAANDRTGLHFFYANKAILCYLFAEFEQALEHSIAAEPCLDGVSGLANTSQFYFYDSLVRLMVYPSVSSLEQENFLIKVANNQDKMQRWAYHAPMNFQHKYDLVEAEKARVLGQYFEAEEFYEQAIQGAKENEYIQEEALAYELAAKFYLERDRRKFAQLYMKEAHYCYERWGATAKVKDLETRYPQFFPQSSSAASIPVRTNAGTTSHTLAVALDLATVMKASQAISSEIELEQLLRSLMQILIENAGAQTGCLILEDSGKWTIEATCELNEGEQVCKTQVLQSIPVANRLPESIIQYVIRTHKSVILNDATREGNFIHDPYLQHNQTQSLLCLPLLNQNKLVGVLYLENQLASGTFTPERSQVLNLLSTQAAIAIENAKLYAKLRASESQMAQFLEAVPVGIGIIDATGRPYYANQRGIQLMGKGIDPSMAPDQFAEVYQVYVAETDRPYPTEKMPIVRALSGEWTTVDDIEIHQNTKTVPVEVWGTPVFDEQGNVSYAIAIFQDITERKQAEKLLAEYNQTLEQQVNERTLLLSQEIEERQQIENALRQSEEQRRLTMDFSSISSWNWNIVENTIEWNDNHVLVQGLVPDELENSYPAWRDRIHPEDIERVEQAAMIALETHSDFEAEYRVVYPDGRIQWLVSRGRGIYNGSGQPVRMLGVLLDISDRKLAEAASIWEERNRMAREIHDTLAQSFTGILLQVGAATRVSVNIPETIQVYLDMIDDLARTGLAEARRSVAALRPQLLEEGNLESALHRLVTQMGATIETVLIYETQGTAYSLPGDVESNLLRIGQEALTNAIKYAYASEIRVELIYSQTQCVLRVKDNGQGFEVGSTLVSRGFGLLGMSERAERIGAQLMIQSHLGQGTEVNVTIERGLL